MLRQHTSFVLGYHGCDAEVGERIVMGEPMDASDQAYDWLGPGIYFWESDPKRAWEWADWKVSRGDFKEPFVVGAVIDLGNCLDLMMRESAIYLQYAYASLVAAIKMVKSTLMKFQPTRKLGAEMGTICSVSWIVL